MTGTVTLGGKPFQLSGSFPQQGQTAPAFVLVGKDLADVPLSSFAGQNKILNIFPSIDTPTCATSVPFLSVIQPPAWRLYIHCGTCSCTQTVQRTLVLPHSASTEPGRSV